VPDRIATELLLISRSPLSGRLRYRSALEKGLRAALFADLAFQERINRARFGPVVIDSTSTDDRILDAVLTTIGNRSDVPWRRWFHQVAADRVALTKELVQSGRWIAARDRFGRRKFIDVEPAKTLELVHFAQQVAELRQQPADARQAVLGILVTVCGSIAARPRPGELRHSLAPLADALGYTGDPMRLTVDAALRGCAKSIRRRSRILG
jgi:hypothetical protein